MYVWRPRRVYFEPQALQYERGKRLFKLFSSQPGVEVKSTGSHNRVTGIPGSSPKEAYEEAKRTLVVGVRKVAEFAGCKPSAHFQIPFVTSCPGMCEYCYLNTTLGPKPYVRVYVNTEEVLERAKQYIDERKPEITIFEAAATSDPLPVEDYTGSLKTAIEFFAQERYGRFRFVTKFTNVDSLLSADHRGHTRFRFSINTESIISKYEKATPRAPERVEAAGKVSSSGYPLGFLIAPIFVYEGWKQEYELLLDQLSSRLDPNFNDLTFELITHRYTTKAKNLILSRNPESELPMNDQERRYKYGQFGYGKFVYPPDIYAEVKGFFEEKIKDYFPSAKIDYLV